MEDHLRSKIKRADTSVVARVFVSVHYGRSLQKNQIFGSRFQKILKNYTALLTPNG